MSKNTFVDFQQAKEIEALSEKLQNIYASRFGKPLCGRQRACFVGEEFVYKVPLDQEGIDSNYHEAVEYEQQVATQDTFIPIAACWIEENGTNLPVLVMERVEPAKQKLKELPEWVSWVDCAQVGYTKNNQLVAYDMGY